MRDAASEVTALAASLEAAFDTIRTTRMNGVPILNSRLGVEMLGLRSHGDAWLGVLVTPWFINLVLLPLGEAAAADWRSLRPGTSVPHAFPAGRFEFLVGSEEGIGTFQMCSLFSPVLEFEDQAAARIAADAALQTLFQAEAQSALEASQATAGEQEMTQAGLSRRGFLRLAGDGAS